MEIDGEIDGMDGDRRWWMGCLATIKLTGAETGGRFSLIDCVLPGQVPVPGHIHTAQDETFYVLEGELTFRIDGQSRIARAGDVLFIPRGTPHEFSASSTTPARFLFIHSPGGLDEFVCVSSEAAPSATLPPPRPAQTREQIKGFVALMARYGMQPA
jgi:quercetin dioxygenase-like cupin family protein